mgnify:CR=1 FL=1
MAKNTAAKVAETVGGKTLEMTRTGQYLEKINATSELWDKASANFANVARAGQNAIYSIQNAAGVRLASTWARTEYPLVYAKNIIWWIVTKMNRLRW